MRLWLKDSERRPDPKPVRTDDRKAMLVGIVLWLIALGVFVVMLEPLQRAGLGWWLWTGIAAIGLGLIGLLYTHWRGNKRELPPAAPAPVHDRRDAKPLGDEPLD